MMKLKDLKTVDNVCVYVNCDEVEYKTLYQGVFSALPDELLNREVLLIGAARKNLLDIQIQE